MKTIIITISIAMISIAADCKILDEPPLSTMAVTVVDETGCPVSNAYVRASTYWKEGLDSGKTFGFTDTNGFFCYEDRVYREIGYTVRKKGHYDSHGEAWWPKKLFEVPETNLVVVLKRIIDPVKMSERQVRTFLPRIGDSIGFDLACGDWIVPDGKGIRADIRFTGSLRYENRFDHDVRVSASFVNPLDGILSSMFPDGLCLKSNLRPPQIAPKAGYEPRFNMWQFNSRETGFERHNIADRGYILQTRTETNKVGEIVSANYAWTDGEITIDEINGERIALSFRYYYNPDPTSRSLEPKEIADQQAKDIPSLEK